MLAGKKKNANTEKQESKENDVGDKIDSGKIENQDTQIPESPNLGIIDNSEAAGSSHPSKTMCGGDFAGTCGEQNNPKQLLDHDIVKNHNRVDSVPALPANLGLLEFKEGIKKRTCIECGRSFLYDLSIHYQDGYICYSCHSGQTPALPKPTDLQTRFDRNMESV